jgi:hypothetical protein
MNNLEKLQKQYNEVINELIHLIGNTTLNLVCEYDAENEDGEKYDHIRYEINNDVFDINSVFVKNNKLCFNVEQVVPDKDKVCIYLSKQKYLEEIPLDYIYDIFKWIYFMLE